MVLGIVLTIGVILAAPKLMKSDGEDGFFRPRANPDAQPVASGDAEDTDLVAGGGDAPARQEDSAATSPDYDFYDLLPGEEVAMSDAQLAAAAREEQARAAQTRQAQPQPLPETTAAPAANSGAPSATAAPASTGDDTPYVLQAGAFRGSGDAEAVKARIALLGLNARVESAQINGATVYRVRMGPYGTASELAAAKAKLASGGLPALAIRAK
jgi:cell division protein FtsN